MVQDTDEEGNGFFFQSSIHHILQEDEEGTEDIEDEIEDTAEEIEDEDEEIEDNEDSSPVEDDDLGFVDEDPTLNEVLDEKFPTASVEDLLD